MVLAEGPCIRHRHSARRISPLAFVHVLYRYHCGREGYRSIHHANETILNENNVVHMMNGRACARGFQVNLLPERERERERNR